MSFHGASPLSLSYAVKAPDGAVRAEPELCPDGDASLVLAPVRVLSAAALAALTRPVLDDVLVLESASLASLDTQTVPLCAPSSVPHTRSRTPRLDEDGSDELLFGVAPVSPHSDAHISAAVHTAASTPAVPTGAEEAEEGGGAAHVEFGATQYTQPTLPFSAPLSLPLELEEEEEAAGLQTKFAGKNADAERSAEADVEFSATPLSLRTCAPPPRMHSLTLALEPEPAALSCDAQHGVTHVRGEAPQSEALRHTRGDDRTHADAETRASSGHAETRRTRTRARAAAREATGAGAGESLRNRAPSRRTRTRSASPTPRPSKRPRVQDTADVTATSVVDVSTWSAQHRDASFEDAVARYAGLRVPVPPASPPAAPLHGTRVLFTRLREYRATDAATPPLEAHLCALVRALGGVVLSEWPRTLRRSERVLLVAPCALRTLKYLHALARGVPIVHYTYLLHCAAARVALPLDAYALPRGLDVHAQEVPALPSTAAHTPLFVDVDSGDALRYALFL